MNFSKNTGGCRNEDKRIERINGTAKKASGADLQKVSAQLELKKPAPQTVLNEQ